MDRVGPYDTWSVREEEFPRGGALAEKLRFLLQYAVLAPSAHNTQPWRFRVEENHVTLLPDFSRALSVSDPTRRELYLSLGCALANLLIAAEHFGFQVAVEEFPGGEGDPAAHLSFVAGGAASPGTSALFAAIPKRHTNRGPYASRPVPVDTLQRLGGQVTDPTVRLDLLTESAKITALAELTAKATLATLGRSDFRSELSRWVRNNYTKRTDGIPGFSVGVPNISSLLAPVMVRMPPVAKAEAEKARTLITSSPLMAVISTADDAPRGWVKAGVAFERVWLAAVAAGLRAAPYAGAFEAGTMHEEVERLLGITGFRSQSLLRLGYGPPDPPPSPRRSVEDVVRFSSPYHPQPTAKDLIPRNLSTLWKPSAAAMSVPRPVFFDLSQEQDRETIASLLRERHEVTVIDTYETQLQELLTLERPQLYQDTARLAEEFGAFRDAHDAGRQPWEAGVWCYLPWRYALLRLLPDEQYQRVRTARNQNVIPADEQRRYYHSTIGIAGLSVGNSCALALVLMGGGKRLRLADPDTLELTNLNRIRGSIADLTRPKVYMTAQQIYELDPYAGLTLYPEGLSEENIQPFFDGPPPLDIVVDEVDNIALKLRIREEAKKRRIPVVMATDNGDSGLVDIERYDLERDLEPFHGRLPKDVQERIHKGEKLPLSIVGQLIGERLVGWEIVERRMQDSLLEIGKTIPTWPQLGGAALANGVLVAVAIRKILTGQPVTNRRGILSLSSALIPDYESRETVEARRQPTEEFVQKITAAFSSRQPQ